MMDNAHSYPNHYVDSIAKRAGGSRVWVISAICIRAEMEFRAHSQSYLFAKRLEEKITAGNISSLKRTCALSPKFI